MPPDGLGLEAVSAALMGVDVLPAIVGLGELDPQPPHVHVDGAIARTNGRFQTCS